jgi:hypothetical protein
MARALQPATPHQDLDAHRKWAGRRLAGILTPELREFCQSGLSIALGSRAADGLPLSGHGLACLIDDSGAVRILLREPANPELLRAVASGAKIAATFSEPRTHRSIQLKAGSSRRVPLAKGDLEAVATQCAKFESELEFVGYTRQFSSYYCAYRPEEVVAIEFVPEEAYVQTPGPGAGSMLTR